jgi:AcrR family transcriptional regulator
VKADSPSRPGGLRARQREDTRDAILAAAAEVFVELGLAAPMERIAKAAGVAVGTLYNHFADRDALMNALFEMRRAVMVARVRDALAASIGDSFRARLQAVVDTIVIAPPEVLRFRRLLFQEAAISPIKAPSTQQLEALGALFAQGRAEGALRADPLGLQPHVLLALLQVAVRHGDDHEASLRASSDEVVRQFMDGAGERAP